jgi:hypothetical protein
MNVSFTMLANYAENNGGLLYIQGGSWDTITVASPLEGGPPGVFTLVRGFYVARLEFHQTETDHDYEFAIVVVDEDGSDVAKIEGGVNVPRNPSIPASWPHPVNLIVPVTGLPLGKPGVYRISLLIEGQHKSELEFRVIKAF